ncbi:cation:dicarboxylate symporter family transporter [Burkholderia sp. Bp8986]|uniref:cation:dicarboxylate symporter family transporter n=1 Tax=Burkholderia sp. Bp8986 TaxID=2184550 RepID=UPI000F5B5325|nr:cation:dicarboxylase symporter family transporter [Burkholderia sp. Bp8986]RQS52760.1 glutamate/aspartate:proton symporter GltP [Burkholderia sp. Bp8986]
MSAIIDGSLDSRPDASGSGLVIQIFIGLALGIAAGLLLNRFPEYRQEIITRYLQPAGEIFIKLIRLIVVPIVFTNMVVGIAGTGSGKTLGRIGIKTVIYFEVTTTIAIVLGLVFGNILQPGGGIDMSQLSRTGVEKIHGAAQTLHESRGFLDLLLGIVPDNIVGSMAKGDLLPIIFFAVLFGLGLQSVPEHARKPVVDMFRGIAEVMFRVTGMVMRYAPVGVFALIAVTTATFGFGSLLPLIRLVAVAYFAMAMFAVLVLGITARLFGFRLTTILRIIRSELLVAFSTCSSATVLPQLMKKMQDYGVPARVATFVIPTGYSFNLDGPSIYLGISTLFIAQLYGIHLSLSEQLVLTITMAITTKGGAAVPGFIFVILYATLSSAGLPVEGLALIAGVDRLIDMGRTALNVLGNAIAPLVVAKWCGEYDLEQGRTYEHSIRSDRTPPD